MGKYECDPLNGVSQGSVLGPLLFQIYVSGILRHEESMYSAAYADDFVIASHGINNLGQGRTRLNEALKRIDEASRKIGLEFDAKKTKVMWLLKTKKRKKFKEINLRLKTKRLTYEPS